MTLTERWRAKYRKYAQSAKGRARRDRYFATAKGKAAKQRKDAKCNARRLWIGRRFAGYAPIGSDVAAIRRHIKERVSAFKQGLSSGAEAQSLSTSTVPVTASTAENRLGGRRIDAGDRGAEKRPVGARITTGRSVRHHHRTR